MTMQVINRKELIDWLDIEIDLSSGNNSVLKTDKWAFQQIKKAIESGRFDVSEEDQIRSEHNSHSDKDLIYYKELAQEAGII